MGDTEQKVEAFFAGAKRWCAELLALREILHACPVAETFKWQSPVYTAHGGNIAILWGFKDYCGLGFFKGVLLEDPRNLLVAPGENSRSSRLIKFTSVAQIGENEDVVKAFVNRAVEVEKAGLKVDFPKDDLAYPDELTDHLDGDSAFRNAFEALTPGRQRGYVLHFSQPKQSKTRTARIEKHAPRILAGKGMHDR